MRKIILLAAFVAMSLASQAVTVETTAGQLSQAVEDTQITSLTVTGTIDARDFHFIGQSLRQLTELDLSAAEIVAYEDPQALLTGSTTSFSARAIPSVLLMGLPLRQLSLPANLECIGQAAFAGCVSLENVTLPVTLKEIAPYAFSGSGLKQVTVPDSVAVVGEGAFSRCVALESAVVFSPVIGDYAFLGDTSLSSVTFADAVATLGRSAFSGCTALNQLTWNAASELAVIGDEAFYGSGVTTFDFESLTHLSSVGRFAFASTPLQRAILPTGTTLGEGAFFYADSIAAATLPSDLTVVPAFAFAGLKKATTEQPMSEGVTTIGEYAFYDWCAAQYFTLPSTLQYIGTKAMAGMTGLQKLDVLGDVAQLGDSVWAYVDQPSVKLDVVNGNVPDFEAAMQWRDFHILHAYLLGDVNGDGFVDVTDVSVTISHLLNEEVPVFLAFAADINGDNVIDVQDVSAIIDLILTGERPVIKLIQGQGVDNQPHYPWTADRMTAQNFSMRPGESLCVEINMDNQRAYTAFQCDVILPEGVSVDVEKTALTSRMSRHSLGVEPKEYGCRLLAYSPAGVGVAGNDGAVLSLWIRADEDYSLQGTMRIGDIILVDHYQGFTASSYEVLIDSPTGVEDLQTVVFSAVGETGAIAIEASEAGRAQVVAMNGASQWVDVKAGATRVEVGAGVYVVRMAGKSVKVVVK